MFHVVPPASSSSSCLVLFVELLCALAISLANGLRVVLVQDTKAEAQGHPGADAASESETADRRAAVGLSISVGSARFCFHHPQPCATSSPSLSPFLFSSLSLSLDQHGASPPKS